MNMSNIVVIVVGGGEVGGGGRGYGEDKSDGKRKYKVNK